MPSARFEAAAEQAKKLKTKPSDDELLELYAYYKQATRNPPFEDAEKPSMFDFKAKYKYKAWEKVVKEGVTPADAEEKYIAFVEKLKEKLGYDASKKPEAVGAS